MTTMNNICPRCDKSLLARFRHGIEIDACPGCRGVWLDRGELERLLARASAELAEGDSHDSDPPSSRRHQSTTGTSTKPHRKRGLLAALGDIFD